MRFKIAFVIGILTAAPAFASSVTVQGGWLHTANSNYGDSAGGDVRLETPVNELISLGAEAGYHAPQSHAPYGDLSGEHALGEVIITPAPKSRFHPYIFAGLGWSWWWWDRSQDMVDKGIEINVGSAFAQKYGGGINYQIANGWYLNTEFSYFNADVPKDSFYEATGAPANVAGNDDRSGRVRIGQPEMAVMVGIRKDF